MHLHEFKAWQLAQLGNQAALGHGDVCHDLCTRLAKKNQAGAQHTILL